jgi:hypothetical protein
MANNPGERTTSTYRVSDGEPLVAPVGWGEGQNAHGTTWPAEAADQDCRILVHHGKGGKDRRTLLPQALTAALQTHLHAVQQFHKKELARERGQVRRRRF